MNVVYYVCHNIAKREEIPEAYKDVDAVIDMVHNTGLARKVARLRRWA